MQGLMQPFPLTLVHVFNRAEKLFPEKGVATVEGDGIVRITYGEWAQRTPVEVGRLCSSLLIASRCFSAFISRR